MREIAFYKFDGAGNDFVLVDIREQNPGLNKEDIERICHRRFGVGADGLMTLGRPENESCDFVMTYYNSDGRKASMCGNGGRCIAAFAHVLGVGSNENGKSGYDFMAFDGMHHAEILMWDKESNMGLVKLGMREVSCDEVHRCLDGWFLDTGSPHYVVRVEDLEHYDVVGEGRRLRNMEKLFPEGTNVDFIEDRPDGRLFVRTYERGVEDETWACGTGVTASAIVSGNGRIVTLGGDFKVEFKATGDAYRDVFLTGPVSLNFKGTMRL